MTTAIALFEAGRQARRKGDHRQAIAAFREAIREQPEHLAAHNNLANALQATGQIEEALAVVRQALVLAPDHAVLHANLGGLLQMQGDTDAAIAACQRAIELHPGLHFAHHNLAKALAASGAFSEATAAYQRLLQWRPDFTEARLDLGDLLQRHGFIPQAVKSYRAALRIAPSARGYNSLGAALQEWGNVKLAAAAYRRALRLQPDFDLPRFNLAQVHENLGDLANARRHYEQALQAQPNSLKLRVHLEAVRRRQADWDDYPARVDALRQGIDAALADPAAELPPLLGLLASPLPPAQYRALAERMSAHFERLAKALSPSLIRSAQPCPAQPERLRIGYLSPDFRNHAVGTLIAGLFQHHRRPDFEVFAYSLSPAADEWTEQVRQGCDHFHDVSHQPPLAIAQRIHDDGIHILVDLTGYTAHCRPLVLALRPAPVQIQYLGYPGTLGADCVPYIIADEALIPESHAPLYSEQVLRLPHAWAATPMPMADRPARRADVGLPEHGMVYCCFNGIHKIDPGVFATWMEVLRQVPDSVLWLIDGAAAGSNERLRAAAQATSIDPARLVFAPKLPHDQYLASYRLADLFLDTWDYNAGATAVGALGAGLPLLTCPGEHYATRMGASLCQGVGMPELVCATREDYLKQAIALGRDPARCASLKARLAERLPQAPLFQAQAFVAQLEDLYRALWQGQQPHEIPTP